MNRKHTRASKLMARPAPPPATANAAGVSELLTRALRHHQVGQLVDAEGYYRKILEIDPDNFHGLQLLGALAQQVGRSDTAKGLISKALAVADPVLTGNNQGSSVSGAPMRPTRAIPRRDLASALSNLSIVLMSLGDPAEALRAIQRSMKLEETDNSKLLFVQCVQALNFVPQHIDFRDNLTRALSEPWGRPIDLARFAAAVIKDHGSTGVCIRRFTAHLTKQGGQPTTIPAGELLEICSDSLLRSLLESTLIFDIELERFLTAGRNTMLLMAVGNGEPEQWSHDLVRLFCALSRQCFINEYVFACSDDEKELVERLKTRLADALDRGERVPELWLAAIAAYLPLVSLNASTLLIRRRWSHSVTRLLVTQLKEAEQERQLDDLLPRITAIDEQSSLAVQRQYEENPYPRWVKSSPIGLSTTISAHLREQLPHLSLHDLPSVQSPEILVAGCGTGQQSIETARRYKGARVLAIDLSRQSLSYAKRKTQELGVRNIEYAQADILRLAGIGRMFDVVEASGVLHHLSDPMAGWRILLSLLRPGGVMRLGLYSLLGRQKLDAARAFIAQRGYSSAPEDIRRCRQEVASFGGDTDVAKALEWGDFFSTSSCRDLLFHVQEHQMTLPEISFFLQQNELQFLGLVLSNEVRTKFRSRFLDGAAWSDLARWHIFEMENSATFAGMYQFWVRKPR